MPRLRNVIVQLSEQDYNNLSASFEKSKADKFQTVFSSIRENGASYDDIQDDLGVSVTALYALRARLYEKIQEYLFDNMEAPRLDLLKKVASIPSLIYDTPRETAIAILQKLERNLKEFDMPNELTEVYSAFKKLYMHSPRQYQYAQLYNKHVAYSIALAKAEDLVADFTRQLGEYYLNRNEQLLEVIPFIKKEMDNVCELYESHHLYLYQSIINASMELFLPLEEHTRDDEAIEDMLHKCDEIIGKYPTNKHQYLWKVIAFLNFEYYHKMGQPKKEAAYFEEINESLPTFLLYNFCCFSSKFLLSKVEHYVQLGMEDELYKESKQMAEAFKPDPADVTAYVNFHKYMAVSAFYAGRYAEAAVTLNQLLTKISFKHYSHAELEIKLLLALCYSMNNVYDLASVLIRSASRKARELNKIRDYENVRFFVKMLRLQMASEQKDPETKLKRLRDKFKLMNQGETHMLEYLSLDDAFIRKLARSVK